MAKKKQDVFTTDEQQEQDTLEANVAAEEAADAAAVESVPDATGVSVEPFAQPEDPTAPEPVFTVDEEGHYVAPKGYRELFIRYAGQRYEHISETADGRWVYKQS